MLPVGSGSLADARLSTSGQTTSLLFPPSKDRKQEACDGSILTVAWISFSRELSERERNQSAGNLFFGLFLFPVEKKEEKTKERDAAD